MEQLFVGLDVSKDETAICVARTTRLSRRHSRSRPTRDDTSCLDWLPAAHPVCRSGNGPDGELAV
jgi:hypothetical protein